MWSAIIWQGIGSTSILEMRLLARYRPLLETGRDFFRRHGGKGVCSGRFVGPVRPVVPFLAGLLRMQPLRFWVYAGSSEILWGGAYIGGGYAFGENWYRVEHRTGRIGSGLLLVVLMAYFAKPYLRRRQEGRSRNRSDAAVFENRGKPAAQTQPDHDA